MSDPHKRTEFELVVLPHLDAAHNLARWLVGHPHDAEELTQDAVVRAYRFYGNFHGGNARAWLLTIVRNTCYEWMQTRRRHELAKANSFDEESYTGDCTLVSEANAALSQSPETILLNRLEGERVRRELESLPVGFREALVLRELEGFSYQEIAAITNVPTGTVMSRLCRARRLLHERLTLALEKESST